jgi:hypothetical protein
MEWHGHDCGYTGSLHIFRNGVITPIELNRDYGDVGDVDISAMDAYSGVEVCTPIFLGEASN